MFSCFTHFILRLFCFCVGTELLLFSYMLLLLSLIIRHITTKPASCLYHAFFCLPFLYGYLVSIGSRVETAVLHRYLS